MDDQSDAMLIRKAILERAGYLVLSALNAEQALQIFATSRVDIVVSDHLLPGATGTEMARVMKLAKPGVPILLLSGLLEPPAGSEQTDLFLPKTEGPERLLQAIAALTSRNLPVVVAARVPSLAPRRSLLEYEDYEKCVATMAHEINNPLESLLNLLYLADADSGLSERSHGYLALARDEVGRISSIAHAVLHESKDADADRLENTNLEQLLRSVLDVYQRRLESGGIAIDLRPCPVAILAVHRGPLRQVFSNLLLNAAAAMPRGGRLQARVSTAREWSGERRHGYRITFADNGCGIATENLNVIFDPFFTTKGSEGNGLGLSLVKKVVQRHYGFVRVRSSTQPGKSGSVFSIFLPAA